MQTPTSNVNDVIDHLAAKLSVPAAHLWQVLLTQVRVSVVQDAIMLAVFSGLLVLFAKYRKAINAYGHDSYGNMDDGMIAVILAHIGAGVISLLAVVWACGLVGEIMNPEYYALKEILATLSK